MRSDILKVFDKARSFVYRNARPLDLVLWQYYFENGSATRVYDILGIYQNADGGFGHALEPDCWNRNSTPVATWYATTILEAIGVDTDSEIVRGILRYLDSGKDFADGKWYNTVKSNNDYPHAVWWECQNGDGAADDNPTVALSGFIVKYADKNSALYKKGADIAGIAAKNFISHPTDEMHTLRNYVALYNYCASITGFSLFDIGKYKEVLFDAVSRSVCKDKNKWLTEYVCKPSFYFDLSCLIFDIVGRDLCKSEAEMLMQNQLEDGSYAITWLWHNDYTEFYVAANWWKSKMLCDNMLYIKALEG